VDKCPRVDTRRTLHAHRVEALRDTRETQNDFVRMTSPVTIAGNRVVRHSWDKGLGRATCVMGFRAFSKEARWACGSSVNLPSIDKAP